MTTIKLTSKDSMLGGAITASLAVLSYLSWSVLPVPEQLNMFLHFFFGIFLIMAFIGIYETLKTEKDNFILKSSALFGILAGAMFMLMTVVQRSNLDVMYELYLSSEGGEKEIWGKILKGVFSVQLGMDVCWDIFITMATIFLGVVLLKRSALFKLIGIVGITVGALTLVLNLYTFPIPPGQSGLFDAGPLVGSWYLLICIILFRAYKLNLSK